MLNEVSQAQNLNPHYTTQAKVQKPQHVVVQGPDNIPKYHLYSDTEATEKLKAINNDVFVSVINTPKQSKKKFGLF